MLTSVGISIHCGQHYRNLQKHAKSSKIASAKICAHVTRVLVKPTPYHALRFVDVTVFARTDITSSLMRFVERGHSETCFSFNCTYMNRCIYILGTFLLAMYAFCDIYYTFSSPFPFQHITVIGIFARHIFYEIVLHATFNSTFGYIQLQTPMFLFNSFHADFKCLFITHILII